MNRPLIQAWAVIVASGFGLAGNLLQAESGDCAARLSLTIHIYNYARISARTLARTKDQVAVPFLRAGIQLKWVDCIPASKQEPDLTSCPNTPVPTDLVLKIAARFDAKAEGFRDTTFGFAAGSQVSVVNERTEEIAREGEVTHPEVLGITIAHELGHALLGPNSHSATGIMRPRWLGADFRNVRSKNLEFTPAQAMQMRGKANSLKNGGTEMLGAVSSASRNDENALNSINR